MAATQSTNDAGRLPVIADALLAAESSSSLVANLEQALTKLDALPSRLYLYDGDSQSFFAVAGLGCPNEAPDVLAQDAFIPDHGTRHTLISHGKIVGMLEVLTAKPHDQTAVALLSALLGPVLMGVQRHEGLLREIREVRTEVTQLLGAGDLLRQFDLDVLLVKILETVMSAVHAEVGAVLTRNDQDQLTPRVMMGLDEKRLRTLCLRDGRMVADTVAADGTVLCLSADEVKERIDMERLDANLTGLLVLPLTTRDHCQGVVVLANPDEDFGPAQRRLAETLCSLAAIALDNVQLIARDRERQRMQRDMELARQIQLSLLPEKPPEHPYWRIAAWAQPCDETGGDYYDFMPVASGELDAVVGDISGHGIQAAMLMSTARAFLRALHERGLPPGETLTALNRLLENDLADDSFMSMVMVRLAGDGSAHYVSAGHEPPLVWRQDGSFDELASSGLPLGMIDDSSYDPSTIPPLKTGEMILLYTDGIPDAHRPPDNDAFGQERLRTTINAHAASGAQSVCDAVVAAVTKHLSGHAPHDDITIVVIERR